MASKVSPTKLAGLAVGIQDTASVQKQEKIPEKKAAPVLISATKVEDPKSRKDTKKEKKLAPITKGDQVATVPLVDSAVVTDTVKARTLSAFHRVKIYKSDLQAKTDSLFFSYSDSVMRCYQNPMIWTQGSQLNSDTLYLQLKNKKLHKMLLDNKGFIVSTEGDSSRFNQVKGKQMTGYFKENKLRELAVDGNAESIYFAKEDSTYTGMNRSLSSRIKLKFGDKELDDIYFLAKPEMTYLPIEQVTEDKSILEGFIWKPKDRPISKESIIAGLVKPKKIEAKTDVKKVSPAPSKKSGKKK